MTGMGTSVTDMTSEVLKGRAGGYRRSLRVG
jgi:hypothetical protein